MGKIETYDFTPDPISLLESNRNLGYSIEEAISDLVDNSISAGATRISYEINWNNGSPFFLLKDNGRGMSNAENELVNSFRLGSKNPLDQREAKDLGRFGFGMKTASLSQARSLSVISKKKDFDIIGMSLDLNFIKQQDGKWLLKTINEQEFKNEIDFLQKVESGTVIRWDNWDRAPESEDDLLLFTISINDYLSVCFHRFIERGIVISHHEIALASNSPIPLGEGAEKISSVPLTNNNNAKQTSFILQHPKNWKEDYENISRFNSFKLFDGFESQQGIYIYRCERLLTPKGGWMGLLKKSNASKLARVVIEYPNDADELWSLDITKTNATIPLKFKKEIEKLIQITKKGSLSKIVKGHKEVNSNLSYGNSTIWKTSNDTVCNTFVYNVDLEHPVFKMFVDEKKIKQKDLKTLLKMISDNLPVAKIIDNNDSDPSKHDRIWSRRELSDTDLIIAKELFKEQLKLNTKKVAFSWLMNFEPFCYFENQLKEELL